METFNLGDKVTYTSPHNETSKGIIKSKSYDLLNYFVVYHCNGDWGNYEQYTGQSTPILRLKKGWDENL